MQLHPTTLAELATALAVERKRQKLSREDAAAVCGVSTSFIRDAESNPENCSLGKLVRLIHGLGLRLEVSGPPPSSTTTTAHQRTRRSKTQARTDFGVPAAQLVTRGSVGEPS